MGKHALVSFDVISLFTKTPIKPTINITHNTLLKETKILEQVQRKLNTNLKTEDIMELLSLVLNTTYFTFNGDIYRQKGGMAMGSPVSPIMANIFMEDLEQRATETAPSHIKPIFWRRYVDDVLAIVPIGFEEELLQHLNTIDQTGQIKFTMENMKNNAIPFLDTLITIQDNGNIKTSVYRKSTHTDQYLHFQSNHPLEHKLSVVNTLVDRCESIVSTEEGQKQEMSRIKAALSTCGYPDWSFKRVKDKREHRKANKDKEITTDKEKSKVNIGLPYVEGMTQRLRRTLKQHNINTYITPKNKLRESLVHPKDKIDKDQQCGIVYQVGCHNCKKVYIGETGRALKTRIIEHKTDVEKNTVGTRTRSARQSQSKI
ncbi:uncharacterized protein [Antedon mediterranea]|uniref:uncharacterized protein n=1 Tax=Antedon mediterranea TaxID=105859 RepID=UPI003AF67746